MLTNQLLCNITVSRRTKPNRVHYSLRARKDKIQNGLPIRTGNNVQCALDQTTNGF